MHVIFYTKIELPIPEKEKVNSESFLGWFTWKLGHQRSESSSDFFFLVNKSSSDLIFVFFSFLIQWMTKQIFFSPEDAWHVGVSETRGKLCSKPRVCF